MCAALHLAAETGDLRVTNLLLACKADPNAVDKMGETPLCTAVTHKHQELAELYLDMGIWLR